MTGVQTCALPIYNSERRRKNISHMVVFFIPSLSFVVSLNRNCVDCKCSHHNSCYGVQSSLLGLGYWSAWMDCWTSCDAFVLACHLLYFDSAIEVEAERCMIYVEKQEEKKLPSLREVLAGPAGDPLQPLEKAEKQRWMLIASVVDVDR